MAESFLVPSSRCIRNEEGRQRENRMKKTVILLKEWTLQAVH
jgi:hypothetical protein